MDWPIDKFIAVSNTIPQILQIENGDNSQTTSQRALTGEEADKAARQMFPSHDKEK